MGEVLSGCAVRAAIQKQKVPAGFVECDSCRSKPGAPVLCEGCLHNREIIGSLEHSNEQLILVAERLVKLEELINHPELDNFLRGVHVEAVHQVERWGTAHDRAKRPADWFWLVGYLAGKALHAAVSLDGEKALHHCISTAAALYNWHCAIKGVDVRMCPGRSDLASLVDQEFPGEVEQ